MGKIRAVSVAAAVVATAVVTGSPVASYAGRPAGSERLFGAHQHVTSRTARSPRAARPVSPDITGPTRIGLGGYSDIVADAAHKHVFISGGTGVNGVAVFNLAGKRLKTLGSTPGATGMTLSANGATLYVALADGDGIREINTKTLTGTTVSTGAGTCPQDVAVTAGTVWFSYACDQGSGSVGALNPSTSVVSLGLATGFPYAPHLAASAGLAGALFTGVPDLSPASIARYDVTGGATPSATQTSTREAGENLGDLTVTPNGKDVIVASGSPYYHQVYSTTDLSNDGTYKTSNYPNSVAVNEQGWVAAGIDGIYSKDIWLYKPGAAKAFKTISFPTNDELQSRGLAFTGKSVFAVTGPFGGPYVLNVASTEPNAPMKITTNGHHYGFGAKVKVTIHLKTPDSAKHVSLYATPAGGHQKLVRSGKLKGGKFTATYALKQLTSFTAVYAGGKTYSPTTKTHWVKVHAKVSSKTHGGYAKHGKYTLVHVGKDPRWITTVSPNRGGNCVVVEAQARIHGPWQTLQGSGACLVLDARSQALGVLQGTHSVGEVARVRGVWEGDTLDLKKTGKWSYVRFTR